jgi:hypothetical protein
MLLDQTVILVFLGVFLIWLVVLSVLIFLAFRFYRQFTKGVSKKELKQVLKKVLKDSTEEKKKLDQLVKEAEKLKKEQIFGIQKIGLVRYNPFAETGGDQSFCLSVLDGRDSGLVISSLHSRDTTRVYAKPVKNGRASGYELSDEEKLAIKRAKKVKK